MTDVTISRREPRRQVRRAVDGFWSVPLRFWALAAGAGLLVWVALWLTDWVPFAATRNDEAIAFAGGLVALSGLGLAVAPLVALRSVLWGTVLAGLPLLLAVVSGRDWPFSVFLALVAVAVSGTWRSRRLALVPAGVSLLLVATLVAGLSVLQVPYGAEVRYNDPVDADLTARLVSLAVYAVAVGLALGAGRLLRRSALEARRLAAVDARAGEVEERAVVMGERARLAHDLHDVVAHHVSLIAVRAETAPYSHPGLSPEARGVLADIAADARSALDELRGVLGVLRRSEEESPGRSPQPGLEDVVGLVETARAAGEHVSLALDPDTWAGGAAGYVAYRVVQEALTNARRHAPGLAVHVGVVPDVARLLVRVTTPYVGASRSTDGSGRGLVGMRERVEGLGGTLVAQVRDDLFVVEADLPRGAPPEDGPA